MTDADVWYVDPSIIARIPIKTSLAESGENGVEICTGSGDERKIFSFDSSRLTAFLLTLKSPIKREDFLGGARSLLGISAQSAQDLLRFLIEENFLLGRSTESAARMRWEANGWRDALDFHLATRDLSFNKQPDRYLATMRERLRNIESGTERSIPTPFKEMGGETVALPDLDSPGKAASLESVLDRSRPFRSFGSEDGISAAEFSAFLKASFAAVSHHKGLLGPYYKRNSPSGGSLHPLETYICVNCVDNVQPGLYHYLPRLHSLETISTGDYSDQMGRLCFNKPGIVTASFVIVLAARWPRHMWKYRYARSYRMVLLDVGHLIQTALLVGTSLNLQSFVCPSVNDTGIGELLQLPDDSLEGVLEALGVGPMQNECARDDLFFPDHAA